MIILKITIICLKSITKLKTVMLWITINVKGMFNFIRRTIRYDLWLNCYLIFFSWAGGVCWFDAIRPTPVISIKMDVFNSLLFFFRSYTKRVERVEHVEVRQLTSPLIFNTTIIMFTGSKNHFQYSVKFKIKKTL